MNGGGATNHLTSSSNRNYSGGRLNNRADSMEGGAGSAGRSSGRRNSRGSSKRNLNRGLVVVDRSEAWLQASQQAISLLYSSSSSRTQQQNGSDYDPLTMALQYLLHLQRLLEKDSRYWHLPPNKNPPSFESFCHNLLHKPLQPSSSLVASSSARIGEKQAGGYHGEDDDDDDDDDDEEDLSGNREDDDEAGDQPMLHQANPAVIGAMSRRRILIRIFSFQSDVYAAKANGLRLSKQWHLGAEQYTYSLQAIHQAIRLADSEISKMYMKQQEVANGESEAEEEQLKTEYLRRDAQIVAVSIQSLTTERDRYREEARRQEQYLLRLLSPQWTSRDQVKQRMGDRWFINPAPKHDYSKQREPAEKELNDIRRALDVLQNIDLTQAERTSELLQDMKGTGIDAIIPGEGTEEDRKRRYNGVRPTDLSRRVSFEQYPDPTEFGWTFTGSWVVCEFFERDEVKLDWYFTTATIKTSLDHPKQGKTQLFGAQVDPQTYIQILINPRDHTGKRYKRRPGKSKISQH